ncbi:predicted ORF [Xanthomonas phage XacN1]|nr:predicted ORF [Xanthomonas phage XacN1]BBA65706.1 predicted ORF [Xanthomonas phage XacN1]
MKISFRTAVMIAIAVGVAGSLLLPVNAKAQDVISQTNATMMAFQPAMTADTSSSKPTTPPPAKLYRERVPGKPEEGFVPVTAPVKKNYQYTRVDYPYGEVLIFEDFVRRNVCYITINNGRISESCVPMK